MRLVATPPPASNCTIVFERAHIFFMVLFSQKNALVQFTNKN